ncbi:acyl-coenzyme A oxidase 3 [Diutina catenulata]
MVRITNKVNYQGAPDPSSLIQRERANAAWDPVKMNWFLEGSREKSEQVAEILEQLERDPVLAVSPATYDQTKEEQREMTARKIDRATRYIESDGLLNFTTRLSVIGLMDPQVSTRMGVHLKLWVPAIRGNGTFEQYKYWVDGKSDVISGIYGCFGMTELAHGSNVPGLETTATFDEKTDEFIIDTPHIGASKWWIGGAAHSATHCAVYARLVVKGKDYGVKVFVVPLRDSQFNLCPGVTVGDIGAKMGRDGIDNGWIQFSHVRIPRFFMLQKFCKVSREGEVTLPPLEQLSYSALLGGRVGMIADSYRMMARITTIALRYAVGRRQFPKHGHSSEEMQIIDYSLHQRRLFPFLSAAYVASAAMVKIAQVIKDIMNNIDKAVAEGNMPALGKSINDLKQLFIDSGSMKSNLTWMTSWCIDECRQACGGHGYSGYNGFGKAFTDWSVQTTWEGDNNILGVHVGKAILRQAAAVQKGKVNKTSIAFLNDSKSWTGDNWKKPVLTSADDVLNLKSFLRALEVGIIRMCHHTLQLVEENGGNFDTVGSELVLITRLRAHHYLIGEFEHRVSTHDDKSVVPYLELMGKNYAAAWVLQQVSTLFLTYHLVSPDVFAEVNAKVLPKLASEIRPHVINYTDSFQLPDMVINAPIGNYDGNIYENYFRVVNAQNPPIHDKPAYAAAHMAMLQRGPLDARDRFEKTGETAKTLSK